jgi:hypothetical protein
MQIPIRPRLSILFLIVQAAYSLSLKDAVGNELITRVDVQQNSLGDLGDAAVDVDAPEQLEMPAPPKAHAVTAAELALVQSKVAHKEMSHQLKKSRRQRSRKLSKIAKDPVASKASAQAALAKSWEKSTKLEAKDADTDVEQLGGQLQNIMSELDAPEGQQPQPQVLAAATKADASEKQVADESSQDASQDNEQDASASASVSEDDTGIEKEAAAATSGDAPKEDAENVVDGAMAYIRSRLAAEEHKSLRLRQLLQESVRGNKNMKQRIEDLRKQLSEGASLQKNLRAAIAKKLASEEAKVANQTKRADLAEKQLQNSTKRAMLGEKSKKFLGNRLKFTKSQVAALLLNLANSSQQNKDLHRQLEASNANQAAQTQILGETRAKMSAEEKELAETKAELTKLQAAKKAEDEQVKALDRQKDFLATRQNSALKRDKILHKENSLLKKQLGSEVQREEQLREMWSKESEAFTWQLRAERANATESLSDLEKARSEFRDLRTRVQKLREVASHGEQSRRAAEDAANKAQFALTAAEAENKQLKGSVPWLEGEVDRQRMTSQNATAMMKQAMKERDTVKAILGEAQKSIVQLQGQYADALQALVVAQAGGTDTSKQQIGPANYIQQFAGLDANPLGAPPQVSAPQYALTQVQGPAGGSSLLELGRDSKALNKMMGGDDSQHARVDLNKESGVLNALLRGSR